MVGLAANPGGHNPLVGILLMLAAYLAFSFIDTGAKWLALMAVPALQLSFMRYVGHFVISTALIGRGGLSWQRFRSEHFGLVLLRSCLLMASTILNFFAVRYIPLTLTSTILFSAPIILCALSWPLLGERVGPWRWTAIMIGFVGILIAIRPFDEEFHWAVLLSLGGAFCFALYSILTRKLVADVAIDTMQFWSGFVGTFALLPFAVTQWVSPADSFSWAIMISLGISGWLGHQLLTIAHNMAPPSMLMPFGYSFILYLTVWSYFVFDHIPTFWTIVGATIIIAAGLIIWARERHLARARKPELA